MSPSSGCSGGFDGDSCGEEEIAGDAVAAHALLDAGMLPLLLRVVRVRTTISKSTNGHDQAGHKDEWDEKKLQNDDEEDINFPIWCSNSAQDAALYTLLHMASVPGIRRILREECGCVEELSNIVNCGRENKKLLSAVMTGKVENGGGEGQDGSDLLQLGLQCMKAVSAVNAVSLF